MAAAGLDYSGSPDQATRVPGRASLGECVGQTPRSCPAEPLLDSELLSAFRTSPTAGFTADRGFMADAHFQIGLAFTIAIRARRLLFDLAEEANNESNEFTPRLAGCVAGLDLDRICRRIPRPV